MRQDAFCKVSDRSLPNLHASSRGYKLLSHAYVGQQTNRLFPWKPKMHLFIHFLDVVHRERLSPRVLWNYSEEDVMGLAVDIGSRTHRLSTAARSLDRLRLRMATVWQGRGEAPVGRPADRPVGCV